MAHSGVFTFVSDGEAPKRRKARGNLSRLSPPFRRA